MTATAKVLEPAQEHWCYRMKDLCESTGLPRQAIHFYIQQGLLPAGRKTGRNMAWYTEEHIDRLHLIKKLQHERFLPLKAIKALLDGEDDVFSPRQHAFLAGVKERLDASLKTGEDRSPTLTPDEIAKETGVDPEDVERAFELGLIGGECTNGTLRVASADVWSFEVLGKIRSLGFTKELGFGVEDMSYYQDLIAKLLQEEVHLISSRLSGLPPEQVATMIEAVLPVLDRFIMRLHATKIRDFFANVL
ncbi:MAG: MerR family transcriptional regulator [Myxococcales bacterium]|nr:MerR family transcriptional regulator [Myxococcales bacterium]MDH3482656.1 MerR family transcriptional regulator [Myxococcales bacterium]